MRILMISLIILFFVSGVSVGAAPEYAKWGTIAVKETQKRYNAEIIDYKHIGRTDLTPKKSEEKFKLWLRSKKGNEFGIYVFIQFDPSTNKIQSIRFSETDRNTGDSSNRSDASVSTMPRKSPLFHRM